jgi:hypothetical protein
MARVSSVKGDNVLTKVNLLEADYVSLTDTSATYTLHAFDYKVEKEGATTYIVRDRAGAKLMER